MKQNQATGTEHYSPGYGTEIVGSYQARTMQFEAAFFRPYLRPGMNILDCGCGPGTITAGLAKAVEPGVVTGIDIESNQVESATGNLRAQGSSNVQFQVANVYELPFDDASFDGAFANALLQHLRDPLRALQEIKRVLKPGSVFGVRDDDHGSIILAPSDTKMEGVIDLFKKFIRESGGDPLIGRRHRELLHLSGFVRVIGTASVECDGTLPSTTKRGELAAALLENMTPTALRSGWVSVSEMKALIDACRAWGRSRDAYDAITWCESVAWKE